MRAPRRRHSPGRGSGVGGRSDEAANERCALCGLNHRSFPCKCCGLSCELIGEQRRRSVLRPGRLVALPALRRWRRMPFRSGREEQHRARRHAPAGRSLIDDAQARRVRGDGSVLDGPRIGRRKTLRGFLGCDRTNPVDRPDAERPSDPHESESEPEAERPSSPPPCSFGRTRAPPTRPSMQRRARRIALPRLSERSPAAEDRPDPTCAASNAGTPDPPTASRPVGGRDAMREAGGARTATARHAIVRADGPRAGIDRPSRGSGARSPEDVTTTSPYFLGRRRPTPCPRR